MQKNVSEICLEDFCFVMKTTMFSNMCTRRDVGRNFKMKGHVVKMDHNKLGAETPLKLTAGNEEGLRTEPSQLRVLTIF